jgi:hypothetical protein
MLIAAPECQNTDTRNQHKLTRLSATNRAENAIQEHPGRTADIAHQTNYHARIIGAAASNNPYDRTRT